MSRIFLLIGEDDRHEPSRWEPAPDDADMTALLRWMADDVMRMDAYWGHSLSEVWPPPECPDAVMHGGYGGAYYYFDPALVRVPEEHPAYMLTGLEAGGTDLTRAHIVAALEYGTDEACWAVVEVTEPRRRKSMSDDRIDDMDDEHLAEAIVEGLGGSASFSAMLRERAHLALIELMVRHRALRDRLDRALGLIDRKDDLIDDIRGRVCDMRTDGGRDAADFLGIEPEVPS